MLTNKQESWLFYFYWKTYQVTFNQFFHLKDYHRPADKPYKVDISKMTNIVRIGFLNTWELANSEKL
jgi:hypothetical protein